MRVTDKQMNESITAATRNGNPLVGRRSIEKELLAERLWAAGHNISEIIEQVFGVPTLDDIKEMAQEERRRNVGPFQPAHMQPSEVALVKRRSLTKWAEELLLE